MGAHNGPPGGAKKGQSEEKKKEEVPEVAKIAKEWFEKDADSWFKEKVGPVINQIQKLVDEFNEALQVYDDKLDGPREKLTDKDFYGGARNLIQKFQAVKEKNQEAGATFGDSLREAVKTNVVKKVRNNAEFLSDKAFDVCIDRSKAKMSKEDKEWTDKYGLAETYRQCRCQLKDIICDVNPNREHCKEKCSQY